MGKNFTVAEGTSKILDPQKVYEKKNSGKC